ncbi:MAG: nucleotidyltransferase domain-containing protein [Acidimicrobiales bacterium]
MPISSVVPSLDGPVLVALAATTAPASLAEVHRRAGRGSKSGVREVLLRMIEVGLVDDVPGGFVLNREHVAAPAVAMLADLHGELVRRIRSTVDDWGGEVALVGLFGSAARRDGDSSSDIDLLVVSDADGLDDLIERLTGQVHSWTGNHAQVIGMPSAELRRLRRAKEPIVARWDAEVVVICGDRRALRSTG